MTSLRRGVRAPALERPLNRGPVPAAIDSVKPGAPILRDRQNRRFNPRDKLPEFRLGVREDGPPGVF
jgi:hypothetical protein